MGQLEREKDQFQRLMEDSRLKMMTDWSKVEMEGVVAFWACSEANRLSQQDLLMN